MKNINRFNKIPGDMKRVQSILNHPEFKKSMQEIRLLEKERVFCCHGMEHLLDVARIAYILNLEEAAGFEKNVVYAAGLLHDVGKYIQYQNGTPHHVTSEDIGRKILIETGYAEEEIKDICHAIFNHRNETEAGKFPLSWILYRADKLSRACYACEQTLECNWSEEKKTAGVIV